MLERSVVFTLVALASCAPSSAPMERPALVTLPNHCGLSLAIELRLRSSPTQPRLQSGGTVRACGLPTAQDIEIACEGKDGVPIPGSHSPDDPDAPNYRFPDYSVSNARCAFSDKGNSVADCNFEIAADGLARRQGRAALSYRFRDLSNSIAHDYFSTGWNVDKSCVSG